MKLNLLLILLFFISSIGHSQIQSPKELQIAIEAKEKATLLYSLQKQSGGNLPGPLTSPEQDCNNAIPVCQNVYTTAASYSGNGATQEIPSNSCLGSNELNSVWYTFTSSTAGNIAFNITPNVLGQDYDFALYNITGTNCSAIASGALTPIRCNFSATGGVTGLSASGTNPSEPASGPNQSTVLATTVGQTYVLIISNYSSSANGYQLDFNPGTASIFDVTPPTLSSVSAPCGSNVLTLNISEQITCASIASNGSDLSISGTGGPYTISGATGVNCGSSTAQITFTISPALSGGGPWVLNAHAGTDGNNFIDNCGNSMPAGTNTVSFNVSPAVPVITGPANVCKGSVFALSSSSAVSYTWTGASVPAGQQNQQTISVTANAAGTLNFNLVVSYGACGTATVTKAVTVTDAPIANFSASPSLTVCAGTLVTFNNTSTYPCSTGGLGLNQCTCGTFLCSATSNQGTFATYLWTFGDGGTAFYIAGSPAASFSPTHTYASAGTYVVSLNASGLINTCSNTKNITVTVLPATPNLTISPSTTICPAQSSTLSVSGGSSYTWTPGASLSSTSNSVTIATPTITTTYSVSAPGCGSNQTATVQVVVGGTPPTIGAISGSTLVCPNSTGITYSVNNVASTNYTWSVPAGASITSAPTNSNVITVNFGSSAGTVSVIAVGTCGTATASTIVNLSPSLNLTVTPNNSSICAGGNASLTVSGATNYTWSPAGSLNTANGATVIASPVVATTYTVIGATGTCTGSATALISMSTSLTLTLTSNTPTVCPGGGALLDVNGATTYTWSPATTLSSPNGGNVTASPLFNTTYTVVGSVGTCTGVATINVSIGSCVSSACNLALIRSTLINAGNIELLGMNNTCSLYFINPQFMTGPQAQAYAQTFGANLISVQSATENADLVQALSNQGYSSNVIWIGFSDALLEGSFVWYDGAPISYSNWGPGEPNNSGGNENCTQIYPNGTWNDLNCSGYNSLSVIEVNICPQVTVVNAPIHCPNTNVNLTASTLLGSPGYTYTWIQSGTETFTNVSTPGNTDVISVTSTAPNTFTVFTEDRYSCPQFATVTLSLNPAATVTANSATICTGQTATLTANGASTYTWTAGLSSVNGSPVTGTPASTQNYTVTGTDLNGCTDATTSTITVNTIPNITVSPNATICPNTSATLTANGTTSYTWSPSSTLSSANGNIVVATPSTSTTYTVQGSNGNGCVGTGSVSVFVSGNGFLPDVYIIQKNSLCDTTILDWLNVTSVTPGLAQGNLPSGVTFNATHSGGGLSTTPSMFSGATFPASYNVPIAATTIRNDLAGTFNFCFSQPVINPQIAFASIGQAVLPITITTGVPYQVLWTGINMTYVNSTTLIGAEGFTIIRFPGSHSCISFNYSGNETYINLAFGVMSATCQGVPICPGDPVELIANGASTYSWSNGATTTTISPTPSVTTTYSVTGLTTDGCSNTSTTTVSVYPSPTVTVNSATICIGQQTATLTANGASTYTWTPGLSAINGTSVTGSPTSTQNYTVVGTDLNGCLNATTTAIAVNPLPTVIVNSSTICIGQQTASLIANGANTYTWSPGLSASNGTSVTGTPVSTQNYTVTATDINGCINDTTTNIVVNTLPTVTANSSTICLGQQTATLIANGANTYTWSAGLSPANGTTVTGTPASIQNYTVVGTDINGCINGTITAIAVNPLPTITVNSSTICEGQQTATLTANGATSYTWSAGLSSATNSIVTGNPIATQSYTLDGMDLNGCISSTLTSITVNPIPVLTSTPDMTVCPLSINTLTIGGAATYTWSPNLYLNTTNGSTVISTPAVSTSYTIDALSAASCSNSAVINIIVSNTVVVTAIAANATICPLGNTIITASGATNYTWSPSATLSSANGTSVTATPPLSQTYTVIGATGTCTNTADVVVTVTVNPTVTIANSPTICSGGSAALNAGGADTYSWTPALNLNSTVGANVNANPNSTKTYTVVGTTLLGCKNFTTVTVSVISTPTLVLNATLLSICTGSSTVLNVNGASSYLWSPALSLSSSTGNIVTATPALTTTYSVFGTNSLGTTSCTTTKSIEINVIPRIIVFVTTSNPICLKESTYLGASGGDTYHWSPTSGLTSPNSSVTVAQPNSTTVYTVTVSNSGMCAETKTTEIVVNPLPTLDAGRDTTFNIDELYVLNGTGSVPVGFLSPDGVPLICNYCPIVEVHPINSTCYVLEAIDANGCRNYDEVCITITKNWDIFIPNAFTPNGDVTNEYFMPKGYGLSQINMIIFDRWGVEIFSEKDTKLGWDGKYKGVTCEQGVYIYQIETISIGGIEDKRTGHLTVLPKLK